MRKMLTCTGAPAAMLALPQWRNMLSASALRCARGVCGRMGVVSATHAPPWSPYTPLVLPYTSCCGGVRLRKACSRACVRKSRHQWAFCWAGGAKCSTRCAKPERRCRVCGWSRSPIRGCAPKRRSCSAWRVSWHSANTRKPCITGCKPLISRVPTSPQPTIKMRWRRKRAGKAPEAGWGLYTARNNWQWVKYGQVYLT